MSNSALFEAAKRPLEVLATRCSKRPLGLAFSAYFPLEVLDAFGLEGALLPPLPREGFPHADAVLQSFSCVYIRSVVDELLVSPLDIGLLACTSGCDSLLSLGGVMEGAGFKAPAVALRLPILAGGEIARRRAEEALKEFIERTGTALSRQLDMYELSLAIAQRNKVRSRVRDLFDKLKQRETDPSFVYAAAIASCVMSPVEFLGVIEDVPKVSKSGIPATLSGSFIPSYEFVSDLTALGVMVVHDDTEVGSRNASRHVQEGPLIEAIAYSLTDGMVHGPTRVESKRARIDRVVTDAVSAGSKLAILAHYKYCDPHAFEAPRLMEALRAAGVQPVLIELDREPGLPIREQTKIETLLETFR